MRWAGSIPVVEFTRSTQGPRQLEKLSLDASASAQCNCYCSLPDSRFRSARQPLHLLCRNGRCAASEHETLTKTAIMSRQTTERAMRRICACRAAPRCCKGSGHDALRQRSECRARSIRSRRGTTPECNQQRYHTALILRVSPCLHLSWHRWQVAPLAWATVDP